MPIVSRYASAPLVVCQIMAYVEQEPCSPYHGPALTFPRTVNTNIASNASGQTGARVTELHPGNPGFQTGRASGPGASLKEKRTCLFR